jgi:hypothetical protein
MKAPLLLAFCLLGLQSALAAADELSDRARANPLAGAPLERFAETLRRPLFSASRRAPAPPAPSAVQRAPEPPPPLEPPSIVLVGVVADTQGAHAVIRPGPSEKMRHVKIGDEIGGWKVAEITPRRIVLALDARTSAFSLFETKNRPSKTAARDKARR